MSNCHKRIGFVLLSNSGRPLPSTRISVLNMLPFLRLAGYETSIVFEPTSPTETPDIRGLARQVEKAGIDVTYVQKVHGPSVVTEVRALRAMGIRTVYGECDRVHDEMVRETDGTIVTTEFLKRQHAPELRPRICVVHDGIERPELFRRGAMRSHGERLRAVLVTSAAPDVIPIIGRPPRNLDVTVVGAYPSAQSIRQEIRRHVRHALRPRDTPGLPPLLGYGYRRRAWDPDGVYDHLLQADVGIIPVDMRFDPLPGRRISYWEVKSENRLTLKMAVGLPVIASPVPAYLDIVEQGINGYIAHDRADWLNALQELRDADRRHRIGLAARETVLDRFSIPTQARKLIAALDRIRTMAPSPEGDTSVRS